MAKFKTYYRLVYSVIRPDGCYETRINKFNAASDEAAIAKAREKVKNLNIKPHPSKPVRLSVVEDIAHLI